MSGKDLLSQKSFTTTPNLHFVGFTSLDQFQNATECCRGSLFKKESVLDRVINYSRNEVMVALKHSSTNVPISMSQEVYLQNDEPLDHCHNSHHGDNNSNDEDNACLAKSTTDSDCIDFGSRVHHQDKFPDALFYNPYDFYATSKGASEYCCGLNELP